MKAISVSELTQQIKNALDIPQLQNILVIGEVSNFIHHSSGHMYFSLKDTKSRIKAVMFRGKNINLNFTPKNGDTLIALGSLGVYETNGEYQLYVENLIPQGLGSLHLAFEELKKKLDAEGLFDPAKKLTLPFLPARIGIITSLTGAALRDILNVLTRRFPGVRALVFPAIVQGEASAASVKEALRQAETTDVDVIIIARGGGSFEELMSFNDEELARLVFQSKKPIVSAIGHETDFTILDFVADLRAPTPSAAAELVIPRQSDLQNSLKEFELRISGAMERKLNLERRFLNQLSQRRVLTHPLDSLQQKRQRVDELIGSIIQLEQHKRKLKQANWRNLVGKLETLSPLQTLSRGYAICQTLDAKQVVKDSSEVELGSKLELRLSAGSLVCEVERRVDHDGNEI